MQAFQVLPVIPALDARISSVAIYGPTDDTKKLLIGTDEGSIMSYSMKFDERSNTFQPSLDIIKSLGHGKKPVTDIVLFNDIGLVFTLCDGYLDVWNPISLDAAVPVPQNRGVTQFCVYGGPELMYQIAVQQRKKELSLPDTASALVWVGDYLFAAIKKEYHLINIHTDHTSTLGPFESDPLIKHLSKPEVLCKRDKLGVIYNSAISMFDTSKPLSVTSSLTWSAAPTSVALHFPYLLSLQGDIIEVHSILSWKLQQTINASQYNFKAFAEGQTDQYVIAWSRKAIYALRATPFPQQAEQLVRAGYTDDGVALVKATCSSRPDYKDIICTLYQIAGYKKLRALEYQKAFSLLTKAQYSPLKLLVETFPMLLTVPPPTGAEGENHIVTIIQKARPFDPDASLLEAKRALIPFLLEARQNSQWTSNTTLHQEILVALYKLYIDVQPGELQNFLRSIPDDLLPFDTMERYATVSQRWHALACLYRRMKLNRKALDIWAQLGSGAKQDREFNGLDDTVQLLSETSDIELINDFSPWVYKRDRNKFKEIFTSNARKEMLPLGQTLSFLSQFGRAMQESYLEWLVLERKVCDEKTESALAWHYLDTVLALIASTQKERERQNTSVASSSLTGSVALLQQARTKLLHFLQSHNHYPAHPLLARIQPLPLHNEKICLYSKLGQYDRALQIIVEDLRDFARAEAFCNEHSQPAQDGLENLDDPLFFELFKSYLKVEASEHVPKKALELLNKYPTKFNPIDVLQALSPDLPLSLLMDYLPKALRHGVHLYRQSQVLKNLEKSNNMQARSHKFELMRKSILITSDIVCPMCRRPIGDKLFVHYPNGVVIHYSCYQQLPTNPEMRRHICPITGQNFLREPV